MKKVFNLRNRLITGTVLLEMMRKVNMMVFSALFMLVMFGFQSCSDDPASPVEDQGILLYQNEGLIDSAWVTCCCTSAKRFFSDTLFLSGYSKVKVEFDGNTNSDGSQIDIYYHAPDYVSREVYSVNDPDSLIGMHSVEFNKPADTLIVEVRTTIFPPVCGPEELKFTRSKDLKVIGVK